jgi:ribose transport system substrate-binding protein
MQKQILGAVAAGAILSGGLAGCAQSAVQTPAAGKTAESTDLVAYTSSQEVADAFDTSKLCGDKPLTIGFAMGVGVTWNLTVAAMVEKEAAAACPNVKIVTTDAQGDPQKAASDVNSLVAQGVDGIFTNPLFGAAQIPSMQASVKAGVPFVTFISDGGAQVPSQITDNVKSDQGTNGRLWMKFMDEALDGKGSIVFLGGAPGQPSSLANMDAIKSAMKDYPGLKLVESDMQPANNTAATVRSVMSGLLAKHGGIDAVITDNGTVSAPILDAYKAAGFDPPALAVSATSNGLNCAWKKQHFPFFSTDGNQSPSLVAFRKLLSSINQIPDPEPNVVAPFAVVDTVNDKLPKCDPSTSPDADWSTTLTDDEMRSLFNS